jgi:hypothetical protein
VSGRAWCATALSWFAPYDSNRLRTVALRSPAVSEAMCDDSPVLRMTGPRDPVTHSRCSLQRVPGGEALVGNC